MSGGTARTLNLKDDDDDPKHRKLLECLPGFLLHKYFLFTLASFDLTPVGPDPVLLLGCSVCLVGYSAYI